MYSDWNCFDYYVSNMTDFEKILASKICTLESHSYYTKDKLGWFQEDIYLFKGLAITIVIINILLFLGMISYFIYIWKNNKNKIHL